jgi:release factor glutamine methyltransferase
LDGGERGLELIHRLIGQSRCRLGKGGKLFLEIGHDQADDVKAMLSSAGYGIVRSGRDFAGIERFILGEK